MKRKILLTCLVLLVSAALVTSSQAQVLSPIEELGKELFNDQNLSVNGMQACATCHAPETGFTGPDSDINLSQAIYPGAILTRAGNRKPPTAAYGGDSPILGFDGALWIGGMFWDGRATGWTLDDPLAEQAQGPFLNPLEQAAPTAQFICFKVKQSSYADLFIAVWGSDTKDPIDSIDCAKKEDVANNYERIARSISAYEQSSEVNPFSSKYDDFLDGKYVLTTDEAAGLALFEGEKAMCSACHLSGDSDQDPPLFTDFTYDNLGVPKNPANPFYNMPRKWNPDGADWIDRGLGGFLSNLEFDDQAPDASLPAANMGKQKVPTLRNVDKRPYSSFVKAYGHNGFFNSLEEIVHFYNTRDVDSSWPPPEVSETVNETELGDLGLSFWVEDKGKCMVFTDDDELGDAAVITPPCEEELIVTFMKTLSDGWSPPE